MAFDFNDPVFIKIMEVGDAIEVNVEGYATKFIVVIKEHDMTHKAKKMWAKLMTMKDRTAKIGKLEELEDLIGLDDTDFVYTMYDPTKGDSFESKIAVAPETLYGSIPVATARTQDRKYFRFI